MNYAPEEIILEITSLLDVKSLLRLPRVCKRFNAILSNDFWKRIYFKEGYDKLVKYSPKFSYRDYCVLCASKAKINVAFVGNEGCGRKTLLDALVEEKEGKQEANRVISNTRLLRLHGDKLNFTIFDIPSSRNRLTEAYKTTSQVNITELESKFKVLSSSICCEL